MLPNFPWTVGRLHFECGEAVEEKRMTTNLSDKEQSELKHMVMSFRVAELQVLLGTAGRNKSGRKHDLLSRALQLLKSGCTIQIRKCIQELYQRRYPRSKNLSPDSPPRSSRINSTLNYDHCNIPNNLKSSNAPVHPKVTFKSLPFYDVLSDVIKPASLISRPNGDYSKADFNFILSEEQAMQLVESSAKDPVKRYQVQLQLRFCLLETTCAQKDCLPRNLSVELNRQLVGLPPLVQPSKAGLEPRRGNTPVDVTFGCHLSDVARNRLEISWKSEYGKNYALCVNVVRPLSSDILLQRLRKKGVRPSGHSQALINEKLSRDPDSEIATTSLKVSLLCPLGKMRMTVPVRPITCTHMQCFDAMLFLQMNERKPSWTCPVCDKPAEFPQLFIDGLFVDILSDTTSEEVIFLDDGRWEPFRAKTECHSLVTPSRKSEMIALDLSNSPKSSPSRNGDQKKKEPVIIDLTCDTSDEDDCVTSHSTSKDFDKDEVHSLSSTSPYRSDSSLHKDDSVAPPPAKQRRTPKERAYWEPPSGTSYPGLPQDAPIGSSSSPRPLNFGHLDLSTERTPQTTHAHPSVYYPPITRADGSQMSMYMGIDQFPNSLDYYLNSFDPFRILPDPSARSSPFLGQQSHLPPNQEAIQRALFPTSYRLPPDSSDVIPID